MDPIRFDALAKALAGGVSRRRALARFGVGGLAAGLAAAGANRAGAALPTAQAETCRLTLVASVRLGPSAGALLQGTTPGELRGELGFALGADGAIERGRLRLEDGTELAVVGQATGRAINLRIDAGEDLVFVLVGTAEQALTICRGAVDGPLTGPQAGDLGDWHATATPLDDVIVATTPPATVPSTATAAATATATTARPETPTTETPTTETPTTETPEGGCPDPGETRCGDACVDLQTDPANCGTCGTACGDGEVCSGGECGPEPCRSGETRCADVCVDTTADPSNCGACGNVCGTGACVDGACACDPGLTDCAGVCVDLGFDEANCGACGAACGAEQRCREGICRRVPCGPGFTNCGGECVDLQTDRNNCGACGQACLLTWNCDRGTCRQPVIAPTSDCADQGLADCGGVCVDLLADPANCGECGRVCESGLCTGGACVPVNPCPPGQTPCGNRCEALPPGGQCP